MNPFIKLSSPSTREFWEIPVLFEDPHLLALAKPAGLLTSPDRFDPTRPNLMKLLHHDIQREAPWARARQITYLANAHRLDFETSGVLLLAKDKPGLVALANEFGAEKPLQTYVMLVHGTVAGDSFKVGGKIAPHPVQAGLMRVDERSGKKALTEFAVRERFNGYALLTGCPRTARPHQIRVHLHNRGLPVVGDALYGGGELLLSRLKPGYRLKPRRTERPLLSRSALHAEQLVIQHPAGGHAVSISAPWPRDLTVAVKYLRRYASLGLPSVGGEQHDQPGADDHGDPEQ